MASSPRPFPGISIRRILLGFAGAWSLAAGAAASVAAGTRISFNDQIQPILSEYCFHCHGPDAGSRKADLRLDRAEYAFQPREDDGPVIVRGDPERSPLWRRIASRDPDFVMPPPEAHKSLRPEHIELLRQWIVEGAEYQEHWAFLKPVREPEPAVRNAAWARNSIDRFVLARLEQAGFTGAPEADRHALLRRVTFDLTGLPPTPAEIGEFVSDRSPDAYERVVDRLLASPRYGEHRARY